MATASQADARFHEALQHFQAGRSAQAADGFGQALALDPRHSGSLSHMGLLAYRAGQYELAQGFLARAAVAAPDLCEPHFNLGLTLQALDRMHEASAPLQRALEIVPTFAPAHLALGNGFHAQNRLDDAAAAFAQAAAVAPEYAQAHMNLANVRREQHRLTEAAISGRKAVELDPASALNWRNLALIHQDQGLAAAAIACFDRALVLDPDFAEAQSGRLYCLNYEASLSAMDIADAHRRWGSRWADASSNDGAPPHQNSRAKDRRLRIGYVSGDLHTHPVGYFLKSVLEGRNRSAFEIYCYSNNVRRDDVTEALRQASDHWRSIVHLPDDKADDLVRSDEIDILIDLSGHTAFNRLGLFTRRPAPIQATWLGYVATTGLPAIDYVLSDAETAPTGSAGLFSESLVRLPFGRFCYAPPDYAPLPARAPQRPPTFGSFNDVMKLNADVIGVWARILLKTPEAKLRLKWMAFADTTVQARIATAFKSHGVDPDRVEFSGYSPHAQMLAEYSDIDVALDPFPFCGGLTTCEALWMGVPVVTLPMAQASSRQSLAFLTRVGETDLAASSVDEYVAIAGRLIGDTARLQALRQRLRPQMAASPLTRAAMFTPSLEAAYHRMWEIRCAGGPPAAFDIGA